MIANGCIIQNLTFPISATMLAGYGQCHNHVLKSSKICDIACWYIIKPPSPAAIWWPNRVGRVLISSEYILTTITCNEFA